MSQAARALHVISTNARRGAEVFAVELNAALGQDLPGDVVALGEASASTKLDVEVLGHHWRTRSTLQTLRQRIRSASVVVAHGSVTLQASVLAGLGLTTPVVYKNIGDPWYWGTSRRRRLQTATLLRGVSAVAALTPGAAKAVQDCWQVPAERVWVTGGGRDPDSFRPPTSHERTAARRALDLDESVPVVLYLGALSPEKRPALAIESVAAMLEAVLLMAGDGPLKEELLATAAQADPRIRLLGPRSEVTRLLHASDALLLTSASEGLPGVLIEAGLSGVPAVTTDVGFARDVVQDGHTGRVVADADPASIASALEWVIAEADSLGPAARAYCAEHFDVAVARDRWLDLLQTVSGLASHGHGES